MLVNQCGYYIRKSIPITYKLLEKKATNNDVDIVPDTWNKMLWGDVKWHFNFLEYKEAVSKNWVMKKMAIAFQIFKRNLNKDYVKKNLTPNFEQNFKNQRLFWDAFVQYKLFEDTRSE